MKIMHGVVAKSGNVVDKNGVIITDDVFKNQAGKLVPVTIMFDSRKVVGTASTYIDKYGNLCATLEVNDNIVEEVKMNPEKWKMELESKDDDPEDDDDDEDNFDWMDNDYDGNDGP